MRKITRFLIAIAIIAVAAIIYITGSPKQTVVSQETIKPVKVMDADQQNCRITLDYIGTVKPSEVKKYSFKSPGLIEKIYVQSGQHVKKGDIIAQLDIQDLHFAVNAAKAQMDGAQAQYDKALNGATAEEVNQAELNVKKAQDAYNYANDLYDKLKELYAAGGIPKQEFDKAKLEMDIRQSELRQAEEAAEIVRKGARDEDKNAAFAQLQQAKTDYEYKNSLLLNATMIADMDGYVVDVLFEQSEMVGAGYPVVVVGSNRNVVSVGLSQKDVALLKIGTTASINVDETEAEGMVSKIERIPDERTRTYNVEIELKNNTFNLGSIADVTFNMGNQDVVMIPISAVLTNNGDYVFIVEDERAVKKDVKLGAIKGNNVAVEELSTGEKIVVEGMKNLQPGDRVNILQ